MFPGKWLSAHVVASRFRFARALDVFYCQVRHRHTQTYTDIVGKLLDFNMFHNAT